MIVKFEVKNMPHDCKNCEYNHKNKFCMLIDDRQDKTIPDKERNPNCPLISKSE